MAVPTTTGERPAEDQGFIDHLRTLAASAASYLRARLHLAGIESKEASAHYLKVVIWLFVAFFGFIFGYIFFCIASVFLIAYVLKVSWMWVLLGAGIVHILVAGIAIAIVRLKFSQPMFAATIAEFKKDQSWLNTPKPETRRN